MYCSQGHENPAGSKFCLHCGEKIESEKNQAAMYPGIQAGITLGDRYLIIRQLGQGGFGKTYLAEDINRFREFCVIKEFSPQVQTAYVLQKAEELFQREATVLYKLQHPQIPRFREFFRNKLGEKEYLFIVQDYVEGQTYRSLLDMRLMQGTRFSEAEVKQLLQQILPVLDYIHSMGVIHRDISPDNLILHNQKGLPILIDFGGVKQVVAAVASQFYAPEAGKPSSPATLLGKIGYAPPEQMQTGSVEPHSDLYALAVTLLVLLTGKQPQELINTYNLTWQWRQEVNLSDDFGRILDTMLSPLPSDRYQTAKQVLQALNSPSSYPPTLYPSTQVPPTEAPTSATVAVSPAVPQLTPNTSATPKHVAISPVPNSTAEKSWWTPGKIAIALIGLSCTTAITVWGARSLFGDSDINGNGTQITATPSPTPSINQPTEPETKFSPEERARKERLNTRRQELGINSTFYVNLINQIFWDENPSLRGKELSDRPEDAALRTRWDKTAAEVLEKLSPLTSESRRKLGTYTAGERDRWKAEVNKINVGSYSLYDLGDAEFFRRFPDRRGKNFLDQPIGQVWHGYVNDRLRAIIAGSAFQRISFEPGATSATTSGTLKAGDGKVFIAQLSQGQKMELKLDASSKVLLSVYSPSGSQRFLEDSLQRNLSLTLPEDGFYEFVVTSSTEASYTLNLTVTNLVSPTPTPTDAATPTPTPTDTATPTPTDAATPTPTPTDATTP
ncbi:protein kinase [Calothrix sp. NIES-4101]|nr:protein kinase [Calothrix sp. NIES-4101]